MQKSMASSASSTSPVRTTCIRGSFASPWSCRSPYAVQFCWRPDAVADPRTTLGRARTRARFRAERRRQGSSRRAGIRRDRCPMQDARGQGHAPRSRCAGTCRRPAERCASVAAAAISRNCSTFPCVGSHASPTTSSRAATRGSDPRGRPGTRRRRPPSTVPLAFSISWTVTAPAAHCRVGAVAGMAVRDQHVGVRRDFLREASARRHEHPQDSRAPLPVAWSSDARAGHCLRTAS